MLLTILDKKLQKNIKVYLFHSKHSHVSFACLLIITVQNYYLALD